MRCVAGVRRTTPRTASVGFASSGILGEYFAHCESEDGGGIKSEGKACHEGARVTGALRLSGAFCGRTRAKTGEDGCVDAMVIAFHRPSNGTPGR